MTASIARVGQALRVSPRTAWLIAACGLVGVASAAALATRQDMLTILVGLAVLGVVTLLGLRWPILPLALFAALIPIEEVVVIEGFGTISRFAGILFAVTYALPRLGHLKFGAMPPAAWAYLAWALVSVGWALDPGTAGGQIMTLLQLFVIAVLVADFVVHRPATVRSILWVYSISATATAVIGIQTFVTAGPRAAVFEGQNPEHFAAVLTVALLFGLHEALNGNRRILGGGDRARDDHRRDRLRDARRVGRRRRRRAPLHAPAAEPEAPHRDGRAGACPRRRGVPDPGRCRADRRARGHRDLDRRGGAHRHLVGCRDDLPVVAGARRWPRELPRRVHARDGPGLGRRFLGSPPRERGAHNLVILTIVELGPIGLLLLAAFLGPLVLRRGWGPEALTVQAALAALLIQALFVDMFCEPQAGLARDRVRRGPRLPCPTRPSGGRRPSARRRAGRPPGGAAAPMTEAVGI